MAWAVAYGTRRARNKPPLRQWIPSSALGGLVAMGAILGFMAMDEAVREDLATLLSEAS